MAGTAASFLNDRLGYAVLASGAGPARCQVACASGIIGAGMSAQVLR